MSRRKSIADLEQKLVEAKGNPRQHEQVRQQIRDAGMWHLADELDRIAARDPDGR
jgi:hypothetical protein